MKRRIFNALGAATLLLTAPGMVYAQGKFPEKAISLVVPSAPGGTTDFVARLIADQLSQALGQAVIVDNKAGAAGNIGNQAVARAKPDGHTLLVAYSGYQVGNPHLFKKAGWDPIKDFEPVAMMARSAVGSHAHRPAVQNFARIGGVRQSQSWKVELCVVWRRLHSAHSG